MVEFLNNLWGRGTEYEKGCRTARQATQRGGIGSLESILGLLKKLKIRAQTYLRSTVIDDSES